MAVAETRLLVLGAVTLFEPVNGYQIRRELMSWGVQEWAHIQPGSIYSALSTLSRQGHLERHDVTDGGREVAVYTTTASGREELQRLHRDAMVTVDLLSMVAFQTAIALIPLIDRREFRDHLTLRIEQLRREHVRWDAARSTPRDQAPPHVPAMAAKWAESAAADLRWCEDALTEIDSGAWTFAGERHTWIPAEDDPGWQMAADREHYRALLASATPTRP